MYAVLTVLPVERIIFKTNIALLQKEDTRINLFELKMLSYDVIDIVRTYNPTEAELAKMQRSSSLFRLKSSCADGAKIETEIQMNWADEWAHWLTRQERKIENKTWFEKNLGNLIY